MISVFDLFKIGIGPSSSHTVGPMKAAHQFAADLVGVPGPIARIEVTLLGSLAWTGKGHATDKAVMLGLAGEQPDTVDPDTADAIVAALASGQKLTLPGSSARTLRFDPARDIVFDRKTVPPRHPNTLAFRALAPDGAELAAQRWCSVGGGFVIREDAPDGPDTSGPAVPYPFASGSELLATASSAACGVAASCPAGCVSNAVPREFGSASTPTASPISACRTSRWTMSACSPSR
jgi:L-serine dehydratase